MSHGSGRRRLPPLVLCQTVRPPEPPVPAPVPPVPPPFIPSLSPDDLSSDLKRKWDGKQFVQLDSDTASCILNLPKALALPVDTMLPDLYMTSQYYSVKLSDIISIKRALGSGITDERILRRFISDVIELIDSAPDSRFVLRPDKIHCTHYGKFLFSPVYTSETHAVANSYRYLPPELLRGDRPIDHTQGMLWSLGVILCEMVHLYPFRLSVSVFVELQNIVETRPMLPHKGCISAPIHWIIVACLVHNPSGRPTTSQIRNCLDLSPLPHHQLQLRHDAAGNRHTCYILMCCCARTQLYLPNEMWNKIFLFLFPIDTIFYLP